MQAESQPIKVCVTGAAGNVGYALSFLIGAGRLLGADTPIDLTLLEIPPCANAVKALVMELNDCAFNVLHNVVGTTDPVEAFKGCQVALLVGARPRGPGMTRAGLLKANAPIFKSQAVCLENHGDKDCKVLVVGNPANTNAAIFAKYAPSFNTKNISSLTRLDLNRSKHQLAAKLGVLSSQVRNIIIWGNHSATQFPFLSVAEVVKGDKVEKVIDLITDKEWIQTEFPTTIGQRGKAIIEARGLSSAGSAASSICDHINNWVNGTKAGEIVSMGVMSDGSYQVPAGINFSFPVTCKDGEWTIVQDIDLSGEYSQGKFKATLEELISEKDIAFKHLEQ